MIISQNAKSEQTEQIFPEKNEHIIQEINEHLKPETKHHHISSKRL